MMVSKTNLLFQGLLFRFHVKFQGCNRFFFGCRFNPPEAKSQKIRFLLGIFDENDDRCFDEHEFIEMIQALLRGMGAMYLGSGKTLRLEQ